MKNVLILFFIKFLSVNSHAQAIPEVGKPCPDFALNHVTHYPKKQVTLKDFSGQWLFLDFWFTGCSSCIHSFPKLSELQKEVKSKAQFLLVGHTGVNNSGGGRNIEEMFEKLRVKQNLTIASAYDSTLAKRWGVTSMPHIIIVDPLGIVRYITGGFDITKEKVNKIINGEAVALSQKDKELPTFAPNLANTDGSLFPKAKILGQSVFTRWNGEEGNGGFDLQRFSTISNSGKENGLTYAKVPLEWLYCNAYLGKPSGLLKYFEEPLYNQVYPFPIYELKDRGEFVNDVTDDSKGFYNYSLTLSPAKATEANLMKYMQQDLDRVFSFSAVVEEKDMPVWKLVALPGADKRIKTKGDPRYFSGEDGTSIVAGFTVRNVAMKDYLKYVCWYINEKEKHPFIDATGIAYNIDITIDADMTNLEDVRKELRKNGLDLVLGTKKMKALVIRDAKN